MSNRTIEEIFRNAWHVGEHYGRFRILIATEGGPDFSASQEANHTAFREHMQRNDIRQIIDIFDEAAKELNLPLGEIDREEFFACYNYYWCNTSHSEIPSGKKIDKSFYLTRLADELGAGLVLSACVNDERFRRDDFPLHRFEILERPIFVGAPSKEIFKLYLKNCRSGIDETIDRLAEQIAEGLSPLEAFDEICGAGNGAFNTYPMGTPSNKFYPELFTICEEPHTFEKILAHIYKWLNDTDRLFPQRKVVLFTDKWIPESLSRYQKAFRRFTRRGVTFDIRLTTDRGAIKIPVF